MYVKRKQEIATICQAFGCRNKLSDRKIGLSLHRFPRDPYLRKIWAQAVGGDNWVAPEPAFLCSDHFHKDNFYNLGRKTMLKRNAIPTKFGDEIPSNDGLDHLNADVESTDTDDNSNFGINDGSIDGSSINDGMASDEYSNDLSNNEPHLTEKIADAMKKLTQNSNMKFMENFDPERSNREKRKLSRKIYSGGKKQAAVYDEKGFLISTGMNMCDCMVAECPGCHFPCPRCRSPKCGHECRVNRKWTYECVEIEGTEKLIIPDERFFKKSS